MKSSVRGFFYWLVFSFQWAVGSLQFTVFSSQFTVYSSQWAHDILHELMPDP